MEIRIEKGEKKPALTWMLFKLMYFLVNLAGFFSLPIELWDYVKTATSHRIIGKKSYFSSSCAMIVAKVDRMHVGRFRVYGVVHSEGKRQHQYITSIYNDRKYSFDIKRYANYWLLSVDEKYLAMETRVKTPIFTHNMLPEVSEKFNLKKDAVIQLYDSAGI
jgi:hypothetical protein